TSPARGVPPSITSLSTRCPFGRRERGQRERVYFLAHPVAERRVDTLMTSHARQSLEDIGDDERVEMAAVACDLEMAAVDRGGDRCFDRFGGGHRYVNAEASIRARATRAPGARARR